MYTLLGVVISNFYQFVSVVELEHDISVLVADSALLVADSDPDPICIN